MPRIAKCQGNFEGLSVLSGSKKFPHFGAYLAGLVSCEILHREAYWLGNPTLKSLMKAHTQSQQLLSVTIPFHLPIRHFLKVPANPSWFRN